MVPPSHRRRERPTFPCPNCSAEVPEGASFCRECGSDESTGWSENTLYDDLDLPEVAESLSIPDTFEEFQRLTGDRAPRHRRAIGLVLLALFILLLLI
ncbi:MAG: zinc-ribbon domain-containing protein [Planctomycetota bacterium]